LTLFLVPFQDNQPPGMVPKKGVYMFKDIARLAQYYQLPLQMPAVSADSLILFYGSYI
jgi:glutathione S-transferase kappa 1